MMQRTALLVVDMLTDFLAPKPGLETPARITSLVENNQKVCRIARQKGIPVVFVNDAFQKTEIPIDRHFKLSIPHAIIGTEEALEDSVAADLVPREQHGMAFGTMAAVNAVGDFLSSLLVGALWSAFGVGAAFGASAVLFAAGAILILRLK